MFRSASLSLTPAATPGQSKYANRAFKRFTVQGTSEVKSGMRNTRRIDAHARFCAVRNWKASLVFLLFSTFEGVLCWRELTAPLPAQRASTVTLLGYSFVVLLLVDVMLSLRCFRERIVLSLGILGFLKAILVGVAPGLIALDARTVREFSFLLWATASLISLSMFLSAISKDREGEL